MNKVILYSFIVEITFLENIVFVSSLERCHYVAPNWKFTQDVKSSSNENRNCTLNRFCKRNYSISLINMPPYSDLQLIESRIRSCCGDCVGFGVNYHINLSEVLTPSFKDGKKSVPDFIAPVLGSEFKRSLYGYNFIPFCKVPEAVYVTAKFDSIFVRFMKSLLYIYPLVIIYLIIVILSGFIIWITETWADKQQYNRKFLPGWFDGVWYSFIAMTTVGFGDRTPKSSFGKLLSILFITIGINLIGILFGLFTSTIVDLNNPVKPDMRNKSVGVLQYKLQDAHLVAMNDGILVEADGIELHDDLLKLIQKLRKKEIDGIVLDKYSYVYFREKFGKWIETKYSRIPKEFRQNLHSDVDFFLHKTAITIKSYSGELFSYGVLARDENVYEYFNDAFDDNRIAFETQFKTNMRLVFNNEKEELFSSSNTSFLFSVVIMAVIIGIFCLFGFIFDIYRRMYCRSDRQVPNEEDRTMLTQYHS